VLLYHFVTGPTGVRKVLPTSALQAGQRLDTMYQSSTTRKPYQLAVNAVNGKLQVGSRGPRHAAGRRIPRDVEGGQAVVPRGVL
jgi:hypothetical protein